MKELITDLADRHSLMLRILCRKSKERQEDQKIGVRDCRRHN